PLEQVGGTSPRQPGDVPDGRPQGRVGLRRGLPRAVRHDEEGPGRARSLAEDGGGLGDEALAGEGGVAGGEVTGEGGERLVRDEQRRATGRPRRAGRGEAARGERRAVGEQRRPRRSWVETGELPGPVVGDDAVRRPQDAPAGVEAFGGGVTAPATWADELTGVRGVSDGRVLGVGRWKHGW